MPLKPIRPGELKIELPAATDAGLHFIGRIRTPWPAPADCPKSSGSRADVEATIEIDERYGQGLRDIGLYSHLVVLYWLDRAPRDLVVQAPSHLDRPRGVFALRSPVRPNPIGLSVVELVRVEGNRLVIRRIDCCDGTPVVDIKPYFASIDAVPNARRP